jgi:hypothetical protein
LNKFKAKVNASKINPTSDGKADFVESLSYIADHTHNGQSLRCILEHVGYTPQHIKAEDNVAKLDLEILCKKI